MDAMRRFLWKFFGVTLDRRTLIMGGICLLSLLAIIVFGVLLAISDEYIYRVFIVIAAIPVSLITMGMGGYRTFTWMLASKSERKEIEREIALRQLRRRVQDKHFQR